MLLALDWSGNFIRDFALSTVFLFFHNKQAPTNVDFWVFIQLAYKTWNFCGERVFIQSFGTFCMEKSIFMNADFTNLFQSD